MLLHFLKEDEQLLIETFTERRVINGPGRVWINPLWKVTRRQGLTLEPTDYIRVRNFLSGELKNVIGPCMVLLGAHEELVAELSVISLKNNEYMRLIDRKTGEIRVERGTGIVYLSPTEEILQEVSTGINIDEETAVLIRNIQSGSLSLITEKQVFIPSAAQEIVEIRKRIILEPHQVVIIKDQTGRYVFRRGTDENRSFFIEPYTELITLYWSSGLHKDARNLKLKYIDLRPKFMWYEFEIRTKDNVELVLNITFFWQIIDVETMIKTTDDTPGDICSHARSSIIQAASQVTMEAFLAEFNLIVGRAVMNAQDTFYTERGVNLISVEVRSIACKDEGTQEVLQAIIQETTNRINRLQKQQSENEIKIEQLRGDMDAEKMKADLVDIQRQRIEAESQIEGQAEANRIQAFLDRLPADLSTEQKIALFNLLRKKDILDTLSKGSAQLFFTPSDVNLSIET